ncbi:ankyrin-3-like [Tigriopus californicus]|uniref:ankyrin-3-like n=1 Tax=Tigriopus californicus TaxID=6832 RepID=UPI0027DAA7F1|nr:ankyrin-3-like [Tigriopus californicus]XP_059087244.1 ankyrin-3-like [Tigriopus californicus]
MVIGNTDTVRVILDCLQDQCYNIAQSTFIIVVPDCALTFIDDPVVVDSAEMNSNGQSTASTPRTGSGGVAQAANLVGQNLNHNDLGGSTTTGGFSDELDDPNAPINQDFMVSLLVDARGGAMHGCRYSGVKVTIPPRTAPQPMRITCRYVRTENLLYPPTLNEGEGLASRVLQMGPVGSRFLGPVLIEVPHVASLRHGERETAILRCDSASRGKWVEHPQEDFMEKILKESLAEESFSTSGGQSSPVSSPSRVVQETVMPQQIVRIVASDFPQYFAVISRVRQDIRQVGPEGAVLSAALCPRARVQIPPKALTKETDIGISAQRIEDDIVEEILVQGGAVSPIVTLEPRRRKFHKAITVNMPLPERSLRTLRNGLEDTSTSAGSSRKTSSESLNKLKGISSLTPPPPAIVPDSQIETSLKLVCSMSANMHRSCWEDVTMETPLSFANGCVQFTSIISASFWLINCPNWMSQDAMTLVDQLYKGNMRVPYIARFFIFARRHSSDEVQVRILCLTEPHKEDVTLEAQEEFRELCKSDFVEIYQKAEIGVKFGGNIVFSDTDDGHHTSPEDRRLRFRPFFEGRESYLVKRRNNKNPYPKGKVTLYTGVDNLLYEAKIDLTKFL